MNGRKRDFMKIIEQALEPYGYTPLIAYAIRFFLRNPYESLAIVDKKGNYEFLDRGSEKFFRLPEGGAKGRYATDLIENSLFPEVLKKRTPIIGKIYNISRNERRIGSAFPIIKDGELLGAVGQVIFRSVDEVERLSKQLSLMKRELHSLRQRQKQQHSAIYTFDNILGVSSNIKQCIELAKKAAVTDSDVLITGESGTGKELFAQAIHNFADPDRPFVSVNSPAIPFDLAESELFGYKRGAFSGAAPDGKPGKLELANNGTLFLDEIGTLPLSIQAKLLRALEQKEIDVLGDTKSTRVKFRLISATNSDLKKLSNEGKFRRDLYYRLAKITIQIDPLRNRREDIPIISNHYLNLINDHIGTQFKRLSDEVLQCFMNYDWLGNTRELINALEQACLKKWKGKEITLDCLPSEIGQSSSSEGYSVLSTYKSVKTNVERELILQALQKTDGNKRRAAILLGMPRTTFYKKLKELHIDLS